MNLNFVDYTAWEQIGFILQLDHLNSLCNLILNSLPQWFIIDSIKIKDVSYGLKREFLKFKVVVASCN